MKICILFAILAAASAGPAPRAISWEKIEDLVQIIRDGMYTTGVEVIRTIANTGNPEVGLIISAKLDEIAVNGTILLDNAYAPIQDRNVSGRDALELFSIYGQQSSTGMDYIWSDVEQLTWDARVKISDFYYVQDIFETWQYNQIPYFLDEIPLNPVNWEEAREMFLLIGMLTTEGATSVKNLITYGNPNVTEELFPVVEAAEAEALAMIDRTVALIGNENLGLREAIQLINEWHNMMYGLNGVISGYEWPNDVSFSFLLLFHEGFTQTHLAGLQIYDALTGIDYLKSGSYTFNHHVFSKLL